MGVAAFSAIRLVNKVTVTVHLKPYTQIHTFHAQCMKMFH
jgi:hypothetical protein